MWHDIEQNSDEWLALRTGKVTGSKLNVIMANYGKAFGEPAHDYAVQIALEQITGKRSEQNFSSYHLERGHEQEPIARVMYEDMYFCDVTNGGFFDNGITGDSPDGLVGTSGVIEIKSVISSVQFKTIKRGAFDPSYKWQLVFHLRESKRDWVDYISFCSDFPEGKRLFVEKIFKEQFSDEFKMVDDRIVLFMELVEMKKNLILSA